MATINDVAKMAGVSMATVSNYLNQTKPVSKKASAKIKAAVDALQYTQNHSAKSLKSHVYTDVGVILPNFNDSYYVQIFHGIESAFQNTDYFINVAFTYDIPELEKNVVRNMLKKQVCGLIMVSCRPDEWKFYYDHFINKGRPIVLIDRGIRSLDASLVGFDDRSSVYNLTRNLLNKNYHNIVLLAGPIGFENEDSCRRGFVEAYSEAGLPFSANSLIQTELNKEDAFRQSIHLLKSTLPHAFITTAESTATGIIEALRLLGYGEDEIPVITLGEEHWNQYTRSFASFSTDRLAIKTGDTASRLLMQHLKSSVQETEKIILDSTIKPSKKEFWSNFPLCPERQPSPPKERHLRILMLDTPVVHIFRGLLKNFEDQAGIGTEITILPHHKLFDEILRSHQNPERTQYDVFMFDIPWLSTLASHGVLDDITEPLQTIDKETFFKGCLKYFSEFHDRNFGIPFMYGPQMFYYRKDLFDAPDIQQSFEKQFGMSLRPPKTLTEFNAIAEFFTTKSDAISYGFSIAAAYDECLAPELYMRLQAYGSSLFGKGGEVVFDNPQTLKAYINFKKALRYANPNYMQANDASIVQDFLQGETAMLITYPPFLTEVYDLRKSSMTGSIGYNLIPGHASILGGWSLGVSSRSHHKQDAFSFLKWTCSQQISNYFALLGGQTAVTSTYTNDELVKLYPWLPSYYKAYAHTRPHVMPELGNGHIVPADKVDSIVCKWAYRMIADEMDVQDVITETHRELEEFIRFCAEQ